MKRLFAFYFLINFVLSNENCYYNQNERYESFISYGNNEMKSLPVVALVLARKGSKGLPGKNLKKLSGISLIGRTLSQIKASKLFDEIWVSTDGDEIANEAQKYGAQIHKRSEILSGDHVPSILVVQNFMSNRSHIHNVALFQCTSVFLKQEYIEQGIKMFHQKDCVFTVTRSFKLRWTYDEKGSLQPLNFNPNSRPRRQDMKVEFIETGMFYFATRHLIQNGVFQNERCGIVVIFSDDSLEIDTEKDFKLAKCLLSNK